MKQTNGYGKSPHSIWETNKLTLQEKTTLLFILDRANRFGKEDKEFNLSYEDFKKAGFDVRAVRKTRQTLIDLNLINYKEGHTGKGSTYSINWQQIVNLSIEAEDKPAESPKEVETINSSTNEINPEFDGFCERTYDIIEEWDNEFNNIVKEYIKGDTESVRRASNKLTDILKSNGLHKKDRESQEIFKYLTEKREMLATA